MPDPVPLRDAIAQLAADPVRRMNVTILAEEGMRVLTATVVENQQDSPRRFRCVRGLAINAVVAAMDRRQA
jgi:hypothetical protein